MPTVMISSNPFESAGWERHDVPHVGEFLLQHYDGVWPETGRIYLGSVAQENEVTPCDEVSIAALETFEEPLWVVVYPGTGVEVAVAISVVALVASVAAVLLIPDAKGVKTPQQLSIGTSSPNNQLGARNNQARPLQRIPDIYGGPVKVIPDVLAAPYITYLLNRQVEIGLYCVGKGGYEFLSNLYIKDGDSPIQQIDGASAHVYGPGDAPTGVGPYSGTQIAIGQPIPDPVLNVYQVQAVNGQVLEPFNSRRLYGATKIADQDLPPGVPTTNTNFFNVMAFEYTSASTGNIYVPLLNNDLSYLTERVSVGDSLWLLLPTLELPASSATKPDLNTTDPGTLEPTTTFPDAMVVTAINPFSGGLGIMQVSIPSALQPQWALVPAYVAGLFFAAKVPGTFQSEWAEITPLRSSNLYTGPFFIDFQQPPGSTDTTIICNFVAPNGLYTTDGVNFNGLDVQMAIRATPCDSTGVPTGASEFLTGTITGSDVPDTAQFRALTMRFTPTFTGFMSISARRLDNRIRTVELPGNVELSRFPTVKSQKTGDAKDAAAFAGQVNDEIDWTHCYITSKPPNISFGDITIIQTMTIGTTDAANLKQRQLNCVVTRLINTWNGTAFTGPAVADLNIENTIFSIMKDSFIGNRPDSEIDFAGIAAAAASVRAYFDDNNTGISATRVGYTFDDFNISFEETFSMLAQLAFCTAFRQSNILHMRAELATDIAVHVFNHRNILVGTQKITHSFGPPTENDSVEVNYVDLYDNIHTKVRVPLFGTTLKPATINMPGLLTKRHAFWHAYRAYQKMQLQRQTLQMQTTQEAADMIVMDRAMISDVTVLAQQKQSGQVMKVSGLNLRLSQVPTFVGGKTYTMFLQHVDETVDAIPVTAAALPFHVTLGFAPSLTLQTDVTLGVPTIYNIVADDEPLPTAWLISQQTAQNNMVFNVSAINYTNMYYFGDSLDVWIKDSVIDYSPSQATLIINDSISTTTVAPRGTMLAGVGNGSITVDETVSPDVSDNAHGYTIAAWVKNSGALGYVGICESITSGPALDIQFGFLNDDLATGHGGAITLTTPLPLNQLHHVAVTYRISGGFLSLFIDGLLIVSQSGVAAPSLGVFKYMHNYNGAVGDIMRWKRDWSARAIFELYQATKL